MLIEDLRTLQVGPPSDREQYVHRAGRTGEKSAQAPPSGPRLGFLPRILKDALQRKGDLCFCSAPLS